MVINVAGASQESPMSVLAARNELYPGPKEAKESFVLVVLGLEVRD